MITVAIAITAFVIITITSPIVIFIVLITPILLLPIPL